MIKFLQINTIFKICLCFSVTTFALYSCKHKKKILKTEKFPISSSDSINNKCRLDFKSSKTLTKHVKENELQYNWLFLKANVNTLFEGEDKGFDAKVKLKKDSIMLITIELLTIDFAKVLITKDSIKMVDYYHKQYFKGDFNFINNLLNADLDFNVIQSVIIGNSAEFSEDDEKLKPVTDRANCHYILSTERKRRLHRIEKGEIELKKAFIIYPELKVDAELFTKTKLIADKNIVFDNKNILKKPVPVFSLYQNYLWRAAAVLTFFGLIFFVTRAPQEKIVSPC